MELLGSWVQNGNKLAQNKNNYIIGRSCTKEEIDRKKKEALKDTKKGKSGLLSVDASHKWLIWKWWEQGRN